MWIRILMASVGMMVGQGGNPTGIDRNDTATVSAQNPRVKMSKPAGDHDIEVVEVDLGDFELRYYIYPVWEAGTLKDDQGKDVPLKYEVGIVLRIDKRTGIVEPVDPSTGLPFTENAESNVSCAPNNCGGACCGFIVDQAQVAIRTELGEPSRADAATAASRACVICTCCFGNQGCRVVLDTCNPSPGDR